MHSMGRCVVLLGYGGVGLALCSYYKSLDSCNITNLYIVPIISVILSMVKHHMIMIIV